MILWLTLLSCAGCTEGSETDSSAGTPGVESCTLCDGLCYETYEVATSASHVEGDVAYADEPPTSGSHNPCWASWGVHTTEVAAENWVHNLEHGGVVFLYDCPGNSCPGEVEALTAYVETLPVGRAILSPYAAAALPFTVVSWEHKLELGCLDLDAVKGFYEARVGQGPEDTTSAPNSACM